MREAEAGVDDQHAFWRQRCVTVGRLVWRSEQ